MKKNTFLLIIGIVFALCVLAAPAAGDTVITTLAELQSAFTYGGNYELGANIYDVSQVSLTSNRTLTLNLKNYDIIGTGTSNIFTINDSSVLNLYGGTGSITKGYSNSSTSGGAFTIKIRGTVNFYGGNISGNSGYSGAIYNLGNFNMYGGTISNNMGTNTSRASGLNLASTSKFSMYGGKISNNNGGIQAIKNLSLNNDHGVSGEIYICDNYNYEGKLANYGGYNVDRLNVLGDISPLSRIYVGGAGGIAARNTGHYTGAECFFSDDGKSRGEQSGDDIIWVSYIAPLEILTFTTTHVTGNYSAVNTPITISATAAPATVDKWEWYYTTDTSPSPASTWTKIGKGTGTQSFTPTAAGDYTFKLVVTRGTETTDSFEEGLTSTVHVVGEPALTLSPLTGTTGDTVTLTATNTGYTSLQWKVSKDGGPYTNVGTANPQTHTPGSAGTYTYQAVFTYTGGLTLTAKVDGSVKVVEPTIFITPKRGNLTTELTLKVKNILNGYTDFLWSVSADGGVNWEVIGYTNPYSYVPGEEGEYLYKVVMSGEDLEDYTIVTDDPTEIKDGIFSESAPISTAAFYAGAIFLILLFMGGLYIVYNDNIFGFIASGFAVLCSWALMMLSAFGHVGDTHVFYDEATGVTVTQVLFIDPSMVYISIFACIIMTIVFIVILARFVAQLALLRARDPEEEEEGVQ